MKLSTIWGILPLLVSFSIRGWLKGRKFKLLRSLEEERLGSLLPLLLWAWDLIFRIWTVLYISTCLKVWRTLSKKQVELVEETKELTVTYFWTKMTTLLRGTTSLQISSIKLFFQPSLKSWETLIMMLERRNKINRMFRLPMKLRD